MVLNSEEGEGWNCSLCSWIPRLFSNFVTVSLEEPAFAFTDRASPAPSSAATAIAARVTIKQFPHPYLPHYHLLGLSFDLKALDFKALWLSKPSQGFEIQCRTKARRSSR